MTFWTVFFLIAISTIFFGGTKLGNGMWFALTFSDKRLEERNKRLTIRWLQAPLKGIKVKTPFHEEIQTEYPILKEMEYSASSADLLIQFLYSNTMTAEEFERQLDTNMPQWWRPRHTFENAVAQEMEFQKRRVKQKMLYQKRIKSQALPW